MSGYDLDYAMATSFRIFSNYHSPIILLSVLCSTDTGSFIKETAKTERKPEIS
jgi:hypothetical protein